MSYALVHGIPHSVLRGAPTITRHYDADGKLTGWSEQESPWADDLDREKALAWWRREQSKHTCGVPLIDLDPKLGGDPNAWLLRANNCPVCAQAPGKKKEIEQATQQGQTGLYARPVPNPESLFWHW